MLYAACDPARYASLGAAPGHRSCAGNLLEAAGAHGTALARRADGTTLVAVPQPLNVFMDVRPERDGTLVSHPASSRAGDFIEFRAELDCLVVLSSCPMDIVPISAGGITRSTSGDQRIVRTARSAVEASPAVDQAAQASQQGQGAQAEQHDVLQASGAAATGGRGADGGQGGLLGAGRG